MEAIKNFVEKERGNLLSNLRDDEMRKNDPIVGQFMRGRVVIEERYLQTLDKILEYIKKEDN